MKNGCDFKQQHNSALKINESFCYESYGEKQAKEQSSPIKPRTGKFVSTGDGTFQK
jgi:hypothetical protein